MNDQRPTSSPAGIRLVDVIRVEIRSKPMSIDLRKYRPHFSLEGMTVVFVTYVGIVSLLSA